MKLTPSQLAQFEREGYLFFPSLFTPAEIKVLTDEVPALYAQRRPENVREKGSDAVRTNFAAHMYNRQFAKLARHPRCRREALLSSGRASPNHTRTFRVTVPDWISDARADCNPDRI